MCDLTQYRGRWGWGKLLRIFHTSCIASQREQYYRVQEIIPRTNQLHSELNSTRLQLLHFFTLTVKSTKKNDFIFLLLIFLFHMSCAKVWFPYKFLKLSLRTCIGRCILLHTCNYYHHPPIHIIYEYAKATKPLS